MTDPWAAVTAARLPAGRLDALAPVRDRGDVVVFPAGDVAWVRWAASHAEVIRCLLPVAGVELFTTRAGEWYRFGRRVPVADRPPDGDGRSLAGLLVPGPIVPVPPPEDGVEPVALTLVRSTEPRPVTALTCELADLGGWANTATTAELRAVRGAVCGTRVVLRGTGRAGVGQDFILSPPQPDRRSAAGQVANLSHAALPSIPGATRLWGESVLVPIGFRPDPDLPPGMIRAAVRAADDEIVLLTETGADLVSVAVFEPLTRAGLRLRLRGRP